MCRLQRRGERRHAGRRDGRATTSGIDFALATGGRISGIVTNAAGGALVLQGRRRAGLQQRPAFRWATPPRTLRASTPRQVCRRAPTTSARPTVWVSSTSSTTTLYARALGATPLTGTTVTVTANTTTSGINFALDAGRPHQRHRHQCHVGAAAPGPERAVLQRRRCEPRQRSGYRCRRQLHVAGLPAGTYYVRTTNGLGLRR